MNIYACIINIEVSHEVKDKRAIAMRSPQMVQNGQDVHIQNGKWHLVLQMQLHTICNAVETYGPPKISYGADHDIMQENTPQLKFNVGSEGGHNLVIRFTCVNIAGSFVKLSHPA